MMAGGVVFSQQMSQLRSAFLLCVGVGLIPTFADVAQSATDPLPFERYQVILDRKPFGAAAAQDMTATIVQPAPDSFAKNLKLSTIIEMDDGSIKVGFVDTRSGKSYMMAAGESQDGIEVVTANWADEEAVLKQGDEMALIKFATGDVQAIAPGASPRSSAGANTGPARPTWEERRRARAAQPPPTPVEPPKPKYTGEELTKHLQEYQMEVIRQGLPPLPIPLTPEMDAKLVSEGVLPAQ